MYGEGRIPDAQGASEIVTRLSAKNYVAPTARKLHENAVLEEYRRFYEGKMIGASGIDGKSASRLFVRRHRCSMELVFEAGCEGGKAK
jgi:hypothetical protein